MQLNKQMALHLNYTRKCTTLHAYKIFKISLQHVSVCYVPPAGWLTSKILKTTTNHIYSYHLYGVS
jgi:hypothetical protein